MVEDRPVLQDQVAAAEGRRGRQVIESAPVQRAVAEQQRGAGGFRIQSGTLDDPAGPGQRARVEGDAAAALQGARHGQICAKRRCACERQTGAAIDNDRFGAGDRLHGLRAGQIDGAAERKRDGFSSEWHVTKAPVERIRP